MLLHKAATFESALADASVAEDNQHLLAAIGESGLVEHKASTVSACVATERAGAQVHSAVALAGLFRTLVIGSKQLDLFTRALQHSQMRQVQLDFSCVPDWNHTDDNMRAILSVLDRNSLEQLTLTKCRRPLSSKRHVLTAC